MLTAVESITKTKTVNLLYDVDVEFVSLVAHGANREPWKVIKSDESGGEMEVLQSILLPLDVTLSDLLGKEGLSWLAQAKQDNATQKGDCIELLQHPAEKFESLGAPQALGDSGAAIILGKLKKDAKLKAGETLIPPVSMMSATVATVTNTYDVSAGEVFWNQVDAMVDSIRGNLSQVGYTPEERKTVIMNSGKAFLAFLDQWTNALGTAVVKLDREKLEKGDSSETPTEDEGMNVEEMKELLKAELEPIKVDIASLKAQKKEETPGVVDPVASALATIEELRAEVATMKANDEARTKREKEEAHEETTESVSSKSADEGDLEEETENTQVVFKEEAPGMGLPKDKRSGVFGGLIFDPKKLRTSGRVS